MMGAVGWVLQINKIKKNFFNRMQSYAYIIEVLVFWRYNPIS